VVTRPRRLTLAGQFLLLQLAIVLVVLVAVAAVSLAQSGRTFERVEGRHMLSVAETVAANPAVRSGFTGDDRDTLAAVAETARTTSGVTQVELAGPDGRVLTSPDPGRVGSPLPHRDPTVHEHRAWTGTTTVTGDLFLTARVPVLGADPARVGELVGIVSVGRRYPSTAERLRTAVPNLLTYLGIASGLGLAGSWLLARRVKRQTHGLEPREIAGLVEHREAMLHGIREGVLALDHDERVTLVNDGAAALLALPPDPVGRTLAELGVDGRLYDVLTGRAAGSGADEAVIGTDRVLVLNRMPVRSRDRALGSVTTLRDRTELVALQRELGTTRTASDTLRAQTHEFANQLHTISGLIQIGEYDEVLRFVDALSRRRAALDEDLVSRVEDPALVALLIAKTSLAAERGVDLRLSPVSRLPRVEPDLSADLTTVVGNLVDNALDALAGRSGTWVEVTVGVDRDTVRVTVRDNGPGVTSADVFTQGYTTKPEAYPGERGFGLALVRVVCTRRGGEVTVGNDGGAVFTARLALGGRPT
jgi:sensor histidine kinase regulating citrate/malate metabolism